MAKLKDLAGLAALGMLGYKLSQGKKGESTTDTGDETSRLAARKPAPEKMTADKTVSDTNSSVLTAIQKPKNIREEGVAAANDASDVTASAPSKPKAPAATKAKPTGMTGLQNTTLANAGRQSKMAAQNDALARANQKAKPAAKSAPPAVSIPPVSTKPSTTKPMPVTSSSNRVPTPEQAAANRQAAMDKVKGFGSSVVDAVTNFETPAERAARERKAAAPFKRGGSVKKMAKGGMTASSRADGIASRGKTRCKMY